jgi:hypothetical protein
MGWITGTAETLLSGLSKSSAARMVTGTAIGAGIGAYRAEGNLEEDTIQGALLGGALGAGIAGLTTGVGRRFIKSAGTKAGKWVALESPSLAWKASKKAKGLASWAWENPRTAIALGVVTAGVVGAKGQGYYSDSSTATGMGLTAVKADIPSTGFDLMSAGHHRQESRMMFMGSTEGLVQGMHRGRH